jgi:hypothetical protein
VQINIQYEIKEKYNEKQLETYADAWTKLEDLVYSVTLAFQDPHERAFAALGFQAVVDLPAILKLGRR